MTTRALSFYGTTIGKKVVMAVTGLIGVAFTLPLIGHATWHAYQDLAGFGRRSMAYGAQELQDLLHYQIGALDALARVEGTRVRYVKPHGALYNDAHRERAIADVILPKTDTSGALVSPTSHGMSNPFDATTAQWAYDQSKQAGAGTDTLATELDDQWNDPTVAPSALLALGVLSRRQSATDKAISDRSSLRAIGPTGCPFQEARSASPARRPSTTPAPPPRRSAWSRRPRPTRSRWSTRRKARSSASSRNPKPRVSSRSTRPRARRRRATAGPPAPPAGRAGLEGAPTPPHYSRHRSCRAADRWNSARPGLAPHSACEGSKALSTVTDTSRSGAYCHARRESTAV